MRDRRNMATELHNVEMKIVIETNKSTYTRDFEIADYGDVLDMLQEFVNTVNEKLGTEYKLQ